MFGTGIESGFEIQALAYSKNKILTVSVLDGEPMVVTEIISNIPAKKLKIIFFLNFDLSLLFKSLYEDINTFFKEFSIFTLEFLIISWNIKYKWE